MMRFSKTVSANMLSIIFISLAAKVSRVAGFFLIAWVLPASEIGRLSLVLASVEILSGLSDFGVDWIVIRRLSQEPEQRSQLVSSSVAAKLVLSAVAYALVVAGAVALKYGVAVVLLCALAGVSMFLRSATNSLLSPLQADLGMSRVVSVNAISGAFYLAGISLVLWLAPALPLLIAMIVAADLLTLLLTRRIANREIPWSWQPKWQPTLRLVAEAAPLGISALFVTAYYRLDTIVLGSFSGYSAVGFYSIAYRATESFLLLSAAFSTSIYPILSEQVRRAPEEVSLLFRRIFCPVVSGIALVALIVSIVSEPLIARFMPRYLPSAIPIAILIWSTVFMFANSVTGTTINSLGWQRLFVRITAVNLAVNLILNLLLIPRWQIAGACVATVATEMANFLQQAWALRSVTGLKVHRVWILAGVAAGGAYLVRNVAAGSIPLLLIVLLSVAGASELLGYYRGFWNSLQISRGWNADGQ